MVDFDFSQAKAMRRRIYKLEHDGIAVTEKGFLSSHRYHVPYESISTKAQEITSSPRKWLVASVLFPFLALVAVPIILNQEKRKISDFTGLWFWGAAAVISWFVFFLKRTSVLVYANDRGALLLYADSPSPEEVAAFVRKLFVARNRFLRSRYFQFTSGESLPEKLARLGFMRDQEVISETEYQAFRRQEGGGTSPAGGPVGFGR